MSAKRDDETHTERILKGLKELQAAGVKLNRKQKRTIIKLSSTREQREEMAEVRQLERATVSEKVREKKK